MKLKKIIIGYMVLKKLFSGYNLEKIGLIAYEIANYHLKA